MYNSSKYPGSTHNYTLSPKVFWSMFCDPFSLCASAFFFWPICTSYRQKPLSYAMFKYALHFPLVHMLVCLHFLSTSFILYKFLLVPLRRETLKLVKLLSNQVQGPTSIKQQMAAIGVRTHAWQEILRLRVWHVSHLRQISY